MDKDRDRIANRHPDMPQDTLPNMPERPAEDLVRTRKPSAKPRWTRLKARKAIRPDRCPYCVHEVTLDGETVVRPAIWRRTENGESVDMCLVHAEPWKAADDEARRKERRRKQQDRRR